MSAIQTLIAAADGTTDEAAHVFVPVSAIREVAKELSEESPHVAQAAMDEDIRQAAVEWALHLIRTHCLPDTAVANWDGPMPYDTNLVLLLDEPLSLKQLQAVRDRALRILRHFGLLIELGDGVVSIKERSNG